MQRKNEFDFLAPDVGYEQNYTLRMPADKTTNWSRDFNADFFVELPSKHYARLHIEVIAGGHNRCLVKWFYNASGSRNLEMDPQATVTVLNQP